MCIWISTSIAVINFGEIRWTAGTKTDNLGRENKYLRVDPSSLLAENLTTMYFSHFFLHFNLIIDCNAYLYDAYTRRNIGFQTVYNFEKSRYHSKRHSGNWGGSFSFVTFVVSKTFQMIHSFTFFFSVQRYQNGSAGTYRRFLEWISRGNSQSNKRKKVSVVGKCI